MEEFIKRHPAWRCFTWMGGFGADSPKGTTLWSSRPAVRKLARSLPQNRQWTAEMTRKKTLNDGRVSVCGGKDLKRSQTYTTEFGLSTLNVWLEDKDHAKKMSSPPTDCEVPQIWGHLTKKERWEDANLVEVFQYVSLR